MEEQGKTNIKRELNVVRNDLTASMTGTGGDMSLHFGNTVTLYEVEINDHQMDMDLMSYIDAVGDKQGHTTNVKANMTEWRVQSETFRVLADIAKMVAVHASKDKWSYNLQPRIHDLWGIRYQTNEYTVEHAHWPSLWSFTYYPSIPESHPGLYFNRIPALRKVKQGSMYMWEGHHWHSVPPLQGNELRYCVAGNIIEIL